MHTCYIYQPHFKTNCFRVAKKEQQGEIYNYVVVTCSPEYNGVWRYKADKVHNYETWVNGKLQCYCVPIDDCERIKTLTELVNPDVIRQVKRQQSEWFTNNIKNRDYKYKEKPLWMI